MLFQLCIISCWIAQYSEFLINLKEALGSLLLLPSLLENRLYVLSFCIILRNMLNIFSQ